ncbi:MAG: CoA transferase [Firmicutes bacterium]|nr:CoA transferase [Bacillota bacterium]
MRPLEGIKVIELATFVAVPTAGKFLADQGAEVIKVEAKSGDPYRFAAAAEWRSPSPYENTSFDLDNGGKKGIILNLKDPKGKEALFKLLEDCDIFLTNWRQKALAKQGLTYEDLHAKFPKMVFADCSGYGDVGPEKDLPGYDFTCFWAKAGASGSLRDKDGRPMNLVPGFGDHVAGFALVGGVLAAYIKAQKTGVGERVTTSLLHTSIFSQAVMILSEQYPQYGESFPISYKKLNNPFNSAYRTADDRYFQTCVPPFNFYYPKFMTAIGREDLADNKRYLIESISENDLYEEFMGILEEAFIKKTAAEWDRIFTEADIPHSICLTYKELLTDPQVEAIGVFQKMNYPGNPDIKVARQPVSIDGKLADFDRGPYLGEHSEEVLKGLGYSDDDLKAMHEAGVYSTWEDLKAGLNG